jgi:hypothetical protein
MQVYWSGYDMTDYFKRPTELYILELTRVIIQVLLFYRMFKLGRLVILRSGSSQITLSTCPTYIFMG